MTKFLDVNDMIDAAALIDLDIAQEVAALEHHATILAAKLANALEIDHEPATNETGFGGLCAAFRPKHVDQPCPPVIHEGDPGGDWE